MPLIGDSFKLSKQFIVCQFSLMLHNFHGGSINVWKYTKNETLAISLIFLWIVKWIKINDIIIVTVLVYEVLMYTYMYTGENTS